MHDRRDLHRVERAAGVQVDEHRGARLRLLAQERGAAREREVDARALDRLQRLDRARELAFEAALVVDLLEELARAEALAFHELEADDAAFGQALRGELQAQVVDVLRRDEQGAAAFRELVGDVHLLERRDDRAAVLVAQVRVQDLVFGRGAPHPAADDERDRRRDDEQQREQLLRRDPRPRGQPLGESFLTDLTCRWLQFVDSAGLLEREPAHDGSDYRQSGGDFEAGKSGVFRVYLSRRGRRAGGW